MITVRLAGCAGVLAVAWHAPITAQSAYPQGWYAGLSGGTTHVAVHRDDSRESGGDAHRRSLRGGVRLNRRLGLEVGMHQAGDLTWTERSTSVPGFHNASTSFDFQTLEISAVGVAPICRRLEGMVRGGLAYYDLEGLRTLPGGFRTPVSSVNVSDQGLGYSVSFGFAAKPTERLHVRLEYQIFDIDENFFTAVDADDATIDTVSIGVDFRVGGSER